MIRLHEGLNAKDARKLTFDLTAANKKSVPASWRKNKTAGKFCFRGSHIIKISRVNAIYERYSFTSSQIYNVDETALTTVQGTEKVLARKRQKQVGHIVSNERGTLVTMCRAISVIGKSIPPFLVFPRKYFKDYMVKDAPPRTEGVASSSEWITSELFKSPNSIRLALDSAARAAVPERRLVTASRFGDTDPRHWKKPNAADLV
ncbi:hypothetical protein ILUMI_05191 [Ignelater luminosus]|uniref:DDE-1 domain-containing protein n=1 Tax=Ignelater luminosus TaxID=2038154 RepID=A0A8K0DDE6_IGNLU|nr:hypothetical protein ILUMI_05191 [Ignelater luminosus]